MREPVRMWMTEKAINELNSNIYMCTYVSAEEHFPTAHLHNHKTANCVRCSFLLKSWFTYVTQRRKFVQKIHKDKSKTLYSPASKKQQKIKIKQKQNLTHISNADMHVSRVTFVWQHKRQEILNKPRICHYSDWECVV